MFACSTSPDVGRVHKTSPDSVSPVINETGLRACDDGVDNDADGAIDCDDPGCSTVDLCAEGVPVDGAGAVAGLDEACSEMLVEAVPTMRPADIVWIVDSSGSMGDEADKVRENLNEFASEISSSGIDHRVVMITNPEYAQVPAPLGTNAERYRLVPRDVGSNAPLARLLSEYFRYEDFLRVSAATHFVVVSDDNSSIRAEFFQSRMEELLGHRFTLHAIVSPGDALFPCMSASGIAAAPGTEYWDVAEQTDGLQVSICSEDWAGVFDALQRAMVVSAALPCSFELPEPPTAMTLDPDQVNVVFTPAGGAGALLPHAEEPSDCEEGGWYYDDADDPTAILLCPDSCGAVESMDFESSLQVAFGCASVLM